MSGGTGRRRRVAVVFGGRSAEHEISCISARAVIDALDPDRDEVVPIGITREGRWRLMPEAPRPPSETGRLPQVSDDGGARIELAGAGGASEIVRAAGTREPIDVVFPVLHGPFGEDGTVQGLFEVAGVPYVGAGVLGSAIGMDKAVQKTLFLAAGLRVAPFEVVRESEWRRDRGGVEARADALGFPLFAKPASLGSSVGITKVHGPAELEGGLREAFRYEAKALIERAIEPVREIECAVLGNDDPVASVCGEIVPVGHEFYDYDAKYLDEHGAALEIPAKLDPELQATIQRMAVAAFRAVECAGMARVDFFVSDDEVLVNEINTIPGFTPISMYPKLWEASGLGYRELVGRLLELAIDRHAARSGRAVSPRELGEGAG
jgi:D-alanine-D-alanine ligase